MWIWIKITAESDFAQVFKNLEYNHELSTHNEVMPNIHKVNRNSPLNLVFKYNFKIWKDIGNSLWRNLELKPKNLRMSFLPT